MKKKNPETQRKSPPTDLDGLLAPVSASEFLQTHWSRTYCHVPGWAAKFGALLPWGELNRIIEQHRLDMPRLRLVMADKLVDPQKYTDSSRAIRRIMVKEFSAELGKGATLVLDQVHELHRPLTSLAESLEHQFGVAVGINVYAGWRTSHGYDIHWDDHDVFILQVSGNKRWLLYESESKIEDGKLPPNPLWDRVLEDGDLLYIPRGVRHVAVPLDQPSLHLTVGVENPDATNFLLWLASEQRFRERREMVLPRQAGAEERLKFLDSLKKEVANALTLGLLERYFENSDATRRSESHLSLPYIASLLPDRRALVRLQNLRTLELQADPEHRGVKFAFNGKVWRFPGAMRALFEALEAGRALSLERVVAILGDAMGEEMARASITTLIKEGIVWVAPGPIEDEKGSS